MVCSWPTAAFTGASSIRGRDVRLGRRGGIHHEGHEEHEDEKAQVGWQLIGAPPFVFFVLFVVGFFGCWFSWSGDWRGGTMKDPEDTNGEAVGVRGSGAGVRKKKIVASD